jgi:hypothetical protein
MSFNVAGLQPYTDQLSTDLITRAVLKPSSVPKLTILPGRTAGTSAINILGAGVSITDYECGYAGATGNTTIFTQQNLVIADKQLKEIMCVSDLRQYWQSSVMGATAYSNETPIFEEAITDLKVREINKYIENTIWQGDGNTLDGLIDQTSVGAGAIDGTSFAAGFASASTAYAAFWNLLDAYGAANPALIQEDNLTLYCSAITYSRLTQSLLDKGNSILGQYQNINNVSGSPENSFTFPGTNVTIFLASGIVDLGSPAVPTVILAPRKYLYYGVGLEGDQDRFRFFYDPSEDNIKFASAFRMGTAALANQCISTVA